MNVILELVSGLLSVLSLIFSAGLGYRFLFWDLYFLLAFTGLFSRLTRCFTPVQLVEFGECCFSSNLKNLTALL
jgi:hypothetical protein